jgi:hypothetical protein
MEQKKKATLVMTFITSVLFMGVTINSINRGIENHQTWRIVLASLGGAWFLFLGIVSVVYFFKKDNETA